MDREEMLAGRLMPHNLTVLTWLVAESRARGLECAADDALIYGHEEFSEYLKGRAEAIRNEAINRPPLYA